MKIVFLIQRKQARGAELFACDLAQELIQLGHEVRVWALFEGEFDLPYLEKIKVLSQQRSRSFFDFPAWRKLAKEILNFEPDFVQAMGGDTLKYLVFSKILFSWESKSVFYNGSVISQYINSSVVRRINQWFYTKVDAVIAVSAHSKIDFQKIFKFNGVHRIIPVGVKTPLNQQKSPPLDYPVLVHVGGFSFEKNHVGLLRIFKKFLAKRPQAKLILIGDGPLTVTIKQMVVSMGLSSQVDFKGVLTAPFESIPQNSILILPSILEGLPAVVIEAFLNRFPVIANAIGGIPEMIADGKRGWLVESGDEDGFVALIEKVCSLELEQLNTVLDQAEVFAKKHYLIEAIAEKYVGVYQEVLSSNGS